MPNKFIPNAENFIAKARWDIKSYELMKKYVKITCPHALFSQTQSQLHYYIMPAICFQLERVDALEP